MGNPRPETNVQLPFGISPRIGGMIVSITAIVMLLWPLGGFQFVFGSVDRIELISPPRPASPPSTSRPQKHQRIEGGRASQLRKKTATNTAKQQSVPPSAQDRIRVGASIALHPPKFNFVGRFLDQWYNCTAARQSMSIVLVFSSEKDHLAFKAGMAEMHPHVRDGSWMAAVAPPPGFVTETQHLQLIAAWKKWYGITYLMDLGAHAPDYGLMLDSELLLYNVTDCGPNSEWHRLYDRVHAREASKLWPVAKVGTMAKYDFGNNHTMTGRDYDTALIAGNAEWLGALSTQPYCEGLLTPGCREVDRQVQEVLFSWWTDLPYLNLTVAKKLLLDSHVYKHESKVEGAVAAGNLGYWCTLAYRIKFPNFEHIAYQQWCILHEGYRFDDVTAVTGQAKWGSYLEDPLPGSRIRDLHPMWLPADAWYAIHTHQVPAMSTVDPPLMYLHVDHFWDQFGCEPFMKAWGSFMEKREGKTAQ